MAKERKFYKIDIWCKKRDNLKKPTCRKASPSEKIYLKSEIFLTKKKKKLYNK